MRICEDNLWRLATFVIHDLHFSLENGFNLVDLDCINIDLVSMFNSIVLRYKGGFSHWCDQNVKPLFLPFQLFLCCQILWYIELSKFWLGLQKRSRKNYFFFFLNENQGRTFWLEVCPSFLLPIKHSNSLWYMYKLLSIQV